MYRDENYSLQILLSRTQAGPGRTVKQEQEEISQNHVQRINLISVVSLIIFKSKAISLCYRLRKNLRKGMRRTIDRVRRDLKRGFHREVENVKRNIRGAIQYT